MDVRGYEGVATNHRSIQDCQARVDYGRDPGRYQVYKQRPTVLAPLQRAFGKVENQARACESRKLNALHGLRAS